MITYEFLTKVLNDEFRGGTPINPWYVILFSSNSYPDRDSTYAVPGYTEFTGYTQATRPEFDEDAVSNYVISNGTNKAIYTISTGARLYGAGIVGGGSAPNTKGNTAGGGILCAAGRFNSSRLVVVDQVISIQYSIGAAAPAPAFEEC